MSAVTASLCSTLLFVGLFVFVSADQKNITAGQNVTLTCRAPNNNIGVIEWSRADLKEEVYVLLYRDGHFDPDHQHPYFKNRVDLQDRKMKDGDVSVILKNVTTADTGTYECRVQKDRDSLKLISIIYLHVVDPPGQPGGDTEDGGKEDGSVGLKVGLPVAIFLLLFVVVAFLIYRKHQKGVL
ncbi:V-set and immunoglobulin domain-containing protein 1-like isoform X3 [Oreochromis aureus]|uniref:V-set and immunoglobulin domain-containing protein 1-like isoform X3 n=1 Tax=Oreochromis aureus TaxID=47969 RepID=UPI0019534CF6|nr:V-set and immunoglobulin domain-containing protein 1-like isoform X3 [Oreochromis aureus]